MAQTYREMGMDTMERLYYERKEARGKAYRERKKNVNPRRRSSQHKRMQMEMDSAAFARELKEAVYNYKVC